MGIRIYKPTSPGRRNMSVSTFEEITTDKPEKSLLAPLSKKPVATTKVKSPPVIKVAVINGNTGSSILNVIKMAFPDGLLRSSMTLTVQHASLLSIMWMVKNGISCIQKD